MYKIVFNKCYIYKMLSDNVALHKPNVIGLWGLKKMWNKKNATYTFFDYVDILGLEEPILDQWRPVSSCLETGKRISKLK